MISLTIGIKMMRNCELSSGARHILLLMSLNKKGYNPGVVQLSDESGFCTRSVISHTKELRQKGFLLLANKYSQQDNKNNEYIINESRINSFVKMNPTFSSVGLEEKREVGAEFAPALTELQDLGAKFAPTHVQNLHPNVLTDVLLHVTCNDVDNKSDSSYCTAETEKEIEPERPIVSAKKRRKYIDLNSSEYSDLSAKLRAWKCTNAQIAFWLQTHSAHVVRFCFASINEMIKGGSKISNPGAYLKSELKRLYERSYDDKIASECPTSEKEENSSEAHLIDTTETQTTTAQKSTAEVDKVLKILTETFKPCYPTVKNERDYKETAVKDEDIGKDEYCGAHKLVDFNKMSEIGHAEKNSLIAFEEMRKFMESR